MPDQNQLFHEEILYSKNSLFLNMLEGGYDLRLRVTGRSMAPFLKTGSFVTLFRAPMDDLRIGDIVFCRRSNGQFVLHRLIQMNGNRLLTKGDSLRTFDLPFDTDDYQGKVVDIEKFTSGRILHRNMESRSARIVNYLIARYQQLSVYFAFIYARLKTHLITFKL